MKNIWNKVLALTLGFAIGGFLEAQTPTIFSSIRVNTTSDLRGNVSNATGDVTINDNLVITGTCTGCGGSSVPTTVQGDILYSSAANVLSVLNKNTTATRYLSNTGASNNPAWAQVDLSNGTTGLLPDASLSSNVALLNRTPQTFTGQNNFTNAETHFGSATTVPQNGLTSRVQLMGTSAASTQFGQARFSNDANAPSHVIGKSRGASVGTFAIVNDGDVLGNWSAVGDDGVDLGTIGASISAIVRGTPAAANIPTAMRFATNGGASNATVRWSIAPNGVLFNTNITTPAFSVVGPVTDPGFSMISSTSATASAAIVNSGTNTAPAQLILGKARGTGTVANADFLGSLIFAAHDGGDLVTQGARITTIVNGVVAADQIPTDMQFATTLTNALVTRMTIGSNGQITTANSAGFTIGGTGETLANFVDDGAATLHYDNTAKIATSATGVDMLSGKLLTLATATGGAGFNLPHGTAPSVPANGDLWTTTTGLFGQINGATVGPFISSANAGGSTTQVQYNNGGSFAGDSGLTYDATNDNLTIAGHALLGDGTVGAPAYSFSGDTDTGIFHANGTPNNFVLATNGVDRVNVADAAIFFDAGAGTDELQITTGGFTVGVLATMQSGYISNGNSSIAGTLDVDTGGGTDEINVTSGLVTLPGNLTVSGTTASMNSTTSAFDPGGGSDELTVTSGTVAMIGTTTGGSAGGVDMTPETGTFTATFDTACTTSPTITFDYAKMGNVVVATSRSVTGFPCTGDSTSFVTTGTPVPASIRPSNAASFYKMPGMVNNGADTSACMRFNSDGTVNLDESSANEVCSPTGWTASGSRDATLSQSFTFSYMLGNP